MRPCSYTVHPPRFSWETEPVYRFHYRFSDLREWINRKGGIIIFEGNNLYTKSRGYWDMFTHKTDKLMTYNMKRLESFDGKFDPDNVINPGQGVFGGEYAILIPKGILTAPGSRKVKHYLSK